MSDRRKKCLCAWCLGFALGITWALGVFLVGALALLWNIGTPFVDLFASLYYGYAATWMGSVIGAAWGFVDAFIFGIIFAWLYNFFMSRCECKVCCACEKE